MGVVKSTQQDNGNLLLEILYGGTECPFGGVDSSAPPAYIDPRCFAAADGFLVIDNKLCCINLLPTQVPTLWNSVAGVKLLKFGTFYNSLLGQLNYALGYKATAFNTNPSGVNYVFYMTAWAPQNIATNWTDVLPITLFNADAISQQASLTLDCISTSTAPPATGSGATFNITAIGPQGQITAATIGSGGVNFAVGDVVQLVQGSTVGGWIKVATVSGSAIATFTIFNAGVYYTIATATSGQVESAGSNISIQVIGPGGTFTYAYPAYASGYTRQQVVANLVAFGSPGGSPDVTLSASPDGFSLVITANVAGTTGNTITVRDTSANAVSGQVPPFYFSARVARNLQGGQITQATAPFTYFTPPASTAEVGGTLYIAGIGPMILKYSGPGEFTTSTMYNGMGVIRKFAGSLIGLRLVNQLGVYTQNQDMIFAWSATEDLDEWSPVTNTGLVTGAGFEELADIGDFLSGLIVSNGTAFILRSQGISYATPTGNATLPFSVNHIGLGDRGEGAQVSNLVCQYDQTGVFVGNSDIYQISGSVSSIGAKIKTLLFQSLLQGSPLSYTLGANACLVFLADVFPLVVLSTGNAEAPTGAFVLFLYNAANSTWMLITMPGGSGLSLEKNVLLGTFANLDSFSSDEQINESVSIVGIYNTTISGIGVPNFYEITEGIPNDTSLTNVPFVSFPQEEVMFGRDVTIDGLYVALWASISQDATVNFFIDGTQNTAEAGLPAVYTPVSLLYASLELSATEFTTLQGNPTELQVFPTTQGVGAFTVHSPQLRIQVVPYTTNGGGQLRFSKIGMYATVDASQRPV